MSTFFGTEICAIDAKAGEVVGNGEIADALEILRTARTADSNLYHFISEINLNRGGDITLFSVDSPAPIIFGRGAASKKLYLLRTFWDNVVKAQGLEKLQSLDLRFVRHGRMTRFFDRFDDCLATDAFDGFLVGCVHIGQQ